MVSSALRDLVPPLAVELLRGGMRYPSWEAAKAAAGAYEDEELNRFRIARSAGLAADGSVLRTTPLGLVARQFGDQHQALEVTDFGGATGELGRDFLAAFPGARYTVVENKCLVAMAPATERLRFACDVPDRCDVFFSSGALQFIDDPIGLVQRAFSTARLAVVLVRNSFSELELYRVQRSRLFENGAGPIPDGYRDRVVSYPHRTVSEQKIQAVAAASGFRNIASMPEFDGVLPYRRQVYGRQLVFVK